MPVLEVLRDHLNIGVEREMSIGQASRSRSPRAAQ
jgi:hypothetical protein